MEIKLEMKIILLSHVFICIEGEKKWKNWKIAQITSPSIIFNLECWGFKFSVIFCPSPHVNQNYVGGVGGRKRKYSFFRDVLGQMVLFGWIWRNTFKPLEYIRVFNTNRRCPSLLVEKIQFLPLQFLWFLKILSYSFFRCNPRRKFIEAYIFSLKKNTISM